ncbi:MAG: TonB-dependent receptor, partial [Kofleriaceae bacterium]
MRLWQLLFIAGWLAFVGSPAFADPDLPIAPDTPPTDTPPTDPAPASRDACTFKLDGHVVDAKTHEPIAGATITVDTDAEDADKPSNAGASALCDGDGHFVMDGLCPGLLVLTVERDDYKKTERRLIIPNDTSVEVQLDALDEEVVEIHDKAPDPIDTRSTTTLSGEALEKKRGKALAEAIADVPGVGQLKTASGVGKPIIRGQFGRRLLLLVDGVRHRAQEWGLDHTPEIDPFTADKLTVVRGASGVRYGPDAIGGAVLVAPPELLREGYAGEAHVIGISNGRGGSVAARLQQAPMQLPGFAYNVDGSYRRLAAAETPDYALDNTGAEEWNVGATAGYRRKSATYQASFRHYQARLGVCTCLRVESRDDFYAQIMRDRPIGSELFEAGLDIERPYQRVQHELAIGRASWDVAAGTLGATYSFQYDHRREYDVVRESVTGPQYNFRLSTHELDLSYAHDPWHINDHWHVRGQYGVVGVAQVHAYDGLPLVPDHSGLGAGAYAIERLVGHAAELEAGVRYDLLARTAQIERQNYLRLVRSGQLAMDACANSDQDPVDCSSTFHTLSASVGGVYRWSQELSTKLDLSTASRPPNPDEQYMNGTSPTFPVLGLGKPDLGPETTYSGSLTTSLAHESITAEASAYVNLIDDYIYFAPALDDAGEPIFDVLITGSFPRFVTRPVDAMFYGADGGVAVKPIDELELSTQVSWVRAKNRTDNGYLVFVPPLRARGELTYKPPAFWGLHDAFVSVNGTFVAKQQRFDLAADFAPPPDAYFLVGADAGASFKAGDETIKVALSGTNLTNARYRDYTSL